MIKITFSIENRCGAFPLVSNALIDTGVNTIGQKKKVTCNTGHRLSDGAKANEYMCETRRSWQEPIETCKSRHTVHCMIT